MSQHNDDLDSMTGRVSNFRPGASSLDIRNWLNDRIRQVLGARTYWTDLITPKVLYVPDAYETGTVSVTPGSRTVTGVATLWPINDIVNTTITDAVDDIGYVEITPAAMTGITEDGILYVDAGTPAKKEVVSVVEVKRESFIAKFVNTHIAGATITQSSLAGLQFRIAVTDPVFTVRNVVSATQLELTEEWQGDAKATQTYRLVRMYLTIASDFKDILAMKDEQTGWPVRLHVPVTEVNHRDARRTFTQAGALIQLVDLGPNAQGNMQYELWPAPASRRQFTCLYYRQWPTLESPNDRPPWFINPTIFVHGAIADALRWRKNEKDVYFNPVLAETYEKKFLQGLENAKNEDESKFQHAYSYRYSRVFQPMGADYWQGHTPEVTSWDFGGGY
jgi:hypothetical protein